MPDTNNCQLQALAFAWIILSSPQGCSCIYGWMWIRQEVQRQLHCVSLSAFSLKIAGTTVVWRVIYFEIWWTPSLHGTAWQSSNHAFTLNVHADPDYPQIIIYKRIWIGCCLKIVHKQVVQTSVVSQSYFTDVSSWLITCHHALHVCSRCRKVLMHFTQHWLWSDSP